MCGEWGRRWLSFAKNAIRWSRCRLTSNRETLVFISGLVKSCKNFQRNFICNSQVPFFFRFSPRLSLSRPVSFSSRISFSLLLSSCVDSGRLLSLASHSLCIMYVWKTVSSSNENGKGSSVAACSLLVDTRWHEHDIDDTENEPKRDSTSIQTKEQEKKEKNFVYRWGSGFAIECKFWS